MTLPITTLTSSWLRSLKKSHRSIGEQFVGLGIFLLLMLSIQFLNTWIGEASVRLSWTFFYLSQATAIWILWRKCSIHALKLECSLFGSQFILGTLWSTAHFFWHEMLLALIFLLLQVIATFLTAIVFWKKERLAGQWMLLPLAYEIFITSMNMAICLLNP
jgi:tryptophan-rich sensory protein